MRITIKQLRDHGACEGSQIDFLREFPSGTTPPITPVLCVKYAHVFNWNWAARRLLTRANYQKWYIARLPYFDAWADGLLLTPVKRIAYATEFGRLAQTQRAPWRVPK